MAQKEPPKTTKKRATKPSIAATLTERQARIVEAALTCRSIREASQLLKIPEHGIYQTLAVPKVAEFFRAAREAQTKRAIEAASHRIHQALETSITTLVKILEDDAAPHSARVQAARTVLEYTIKPADTQRAGLSGPQLVINIGIGADAGPQVARYLDAGDVVEGAVVSANYVGSGNDAGNGPDFNE